MDQNPREPRIAAGLPPSTESRDAGGRAFEVRVAGLVPHHVLHQFADVEVTSQETRTVLVYRCQDQAELHGFLARLRTFGLEVVEVRRVVTRSVDEKPAEDDL
ncbi:hypothetical protein [Nocardioides sp. LHG3406-4]|uniref:hypothetical protein n=1 Tax=Nocardioides sp. LHG3406-4 TaxID=2804575 RepID=UPI003CEDEF69